MGGAVGRALARGGARVVATVAGRSERTRALAEGLELLPSLDDVLREADIVLSIVPPGEAEQVARACVDARLFADLNAVSPQTVRRIAPDVDGSISGPPPTKSGVTRIYLSGPRAHEVAALPFDDVETVVVGDDLGLASAVKMCTASVYKGNVGLLGHALVTAHANGVLEHVLDDLGRLAERAGPRLARSATKAHRYVAEMREIAETQAAAGLPHELFEGFAAAYEALARRPLALHAPEDVGEDTKLEDVLEGMT
jgi:3-hydroxyisobutyrate dehydrogenase-like beta-hydroxyacid dehydrogenase